MQSILWLNTGSRLCVDNFLYFSLAEEALIPTHHLMLNASSKHTQTHIQISQMSAINIKHSFFALLCIDAFRQN